ncbi:MAG: glycosyltransferase family 4 protein [Rhodospirillaceae bacterium]
MRIVLINTSDMQGGAARSAHRLHKGLCEIGADSTYFVQSKTIDDPTVQQFIPDPSPQAIKHRLMARSDFDLAYNAYAKTRSPDIELFSQERVDSDEDFFIQRPRADVINLHWIARFVDYQLFFTPERTRCPVVWTLHDMNAFTGGCHYDQSCGKFIEKCGACPLLGSEIESDLSEKIFLAKKRIFEAWPSEQLHIVAPSRWLAGEAQKSMLLSKFQTSVIPYGIETEIFKPTEKAKARHILNLPQDAQIILFVSNHIGLARKGFRELAHAMSLVPDSKNLMLVGVGDSHVLDIEVPFQVRQIDFVNDDQMTALIYSAADLTAIPSKQDNLPNTILESMSCGTPVVGFQVGGIPDIVRHGENGFLAESGNVVDLSGIIEKGLSDAHKLNACGRRARALIERDHKLSDQASAYAELYDSIIGRTKIDS